MKQRAIFLSILAIVGMFFYPFAAKADTFRRVAAINCDAEHNRFMVRFAIQWNEEELNAATLSIIHHPLAEAMQALPANEEECALANGKKLSVKVMEKQAFPFGAGGADPDAYFIMTMDGGNIYNGRTFYRGYGVEKDEINAIIYSGENGGQLLECHPATDGTYKNQQRPLVKKVTDVEATQSACIDVSQRFIALGAGSNKNASGIITDEEMKFAKANERKAELEHNLSPFCHRFIQANKETGYDEWGRENIGSVPIKGGSPPFHFSLDKVDINNDGRPDEVYFINGSTHYFYGNYLVAFTRKQSKAKDFEKFMLNTPYELDEKIQQIKLLPQWKAYLINIGKQQRYSSNRVIAFEGKNYIYTQALNRDLVPSAMLSEMARDNHINTVCQFPQNPNLILP